MKRFVYICLISFLTSCSNAFLKTGAISEKNRMNMTSLQVGMTQEQVLDAMGYPYKTEEKTYEEKTYEIWYYITSPTILGQTELVTRNLTPLVFESGFLKGWGRNFYKYTFDIDNEKWKRQHEKEQKYTEDKEEWPRTEHAIISPMNEPQKEPTDENREEEINKEILEIEHPQIKSEKASKAKQMEKAKKEPIIKNKPKQVQAKRKTRKETNKAKPVDRRCRQKPSSDQEEYIFWE